MGRWSNYLFWGCDSGRRGIYGIHGIFLTVDRNTKSKTYGIRNSDTDAGTGKGSGAGIYFYFSQISLLEIFFFEAREKKAKNVLISGRVDFVHE